MADVPDTRPSLLMRIRDARDAEAWGQFVGIYAPLVYGYARGRGLQDADASDLMQDVLRSVAATIGRFDYDPQLGRFRSWLGTVVHHRLHEYFARCRRETRGTGDSEVREMLEQQPEPMDEYDLWDREYDQSLVKWGFEQVRGRFNDSTVQAFRLTAIEGRSGEEAAKALGITVAAVYLSKSRVIAAVKEKIQQVEGG